MPVRLLTIFLVILSFKLYSQNEETQAAKIARIKVGMNEIQVKKIAGNPEIVEHFKTLKRNTRDTCTYWRYEDDVTIIFKRHIVVEIERDHNSLLQRIQEWADKKNKDSIIIF